MPTNYNKHMAHSTKQTITISIETLDAILRALDGDEGLLEELREQKNTVGSPMHMLIEKFYQQQAWLSVKASSADITADQLRRLYHYDPETGVITKKVRSNADHGEKVAIGSFDKGYVRILIGKRLYLAHRLAFLYMTGEWPSQVVDHINGNRADNRFCNLRDVDQGTNVLNRGFDYVQNQHGLAGVRLDPKSGKYESVMLHRKKRIPLGKYATAQEAHLAYAEAKRKSRQGEEPDQLFGRKFKGYFFEKSTGKYVAQVKHNGKTIYLGKYASEEEACIAHIEAKQKLEDGHSATDFRKVKGYSYSKTRGTFSATIQQNNKTFWLGEFETQEEARSAYISAKEKLDRGEPLPNPVKGYSFNKHAGKFFASIQRNGKSVYLGLFDTEDEARAAYLQAAAELSDKKLTENGAQDL
jgi:hypothetical protein